ncbi:MAG: phenylalanine--tRNA ligase subunit beta [Alphaproteobacteria bacterium]|nr:phenylalanine--tRNA ligase subunit beta [Alphaproteobacteria bacterium]
MKFTLSWLRAHLSGDASLDAIVSRLSAIGLEVESVQDRAKSLASLRIAHVVEAGPHPNADRLRVARVDTGAGGIVNVVCGAPNCRTGMKAVFAPPGTYIPGTGITLKASMIRGAESNGMLCSARELELGNDHDGILDLPADAPVGTAFAAWAGLDDPVIEIGVTPNRGDALGVRGVARDLAAAGLGTLVPFAPAAVPAAIASPMRWALDFPAPAADACPYVLGRTITGVTNGASPKWLQDRLTAIGLRPISALVDITNFFTFDLGRPLHVYDIDRLAGRTLTIRLGRGERFLALNGKEYEANIDDVVIADGETVHGLGGIIGGEHSGCAAGTRSVFLECAYFDPRRMAATGRRLGLQTDARYRFERGIDPALMPAAVEAATRMIQELCGGQASEVVAAGAMPGAARSASMRLSRLKEFGGADIPAGTALRILDRLGFAEAREEGGRITVMVPSWRHDVAQPGASAVEIEHDLVEEVLRIHGFEHIPATSLPRPREASGAARAVPAPALTPRQGRTNLVRRTLAARGLAECVTYSFMDARHAAHFGGVPDTLKLVNPIAADLDAMRPSVLANLLAAARSNADRGYPDVALFEIGPVFRDDTEAGQHAVAAGLRAGLVLPRHPEAPQGRGADAFDAKADALAALAAMGQPLDALSVTADAPGWFHPGRSGTLRQGPKTVLGWFGELHPRLLAAFGTTGPVAAFEVLLDAVAEPKRRRKGAVSLAALQPLARDFAFLVDADTPAEAVLKAARGAERTLIAGVSLFDVYQGEKLPAGKKSLAIAVTIQPADKTLTDAEIEAVAQKLVAAVAKATGATLRG